MKKLKSIKFFLIVILCIVVSCLPSVATDGVTIAYENSSENFSNPERGFYIQFNPIGDQPTSELKLSALQQVRSQNLTLARQYYLLSDFRNKPISESFLNTVSADCETARKAGIKLIMRFGYNWLGGGEDAAQGTIINHLDQLKPIFQDNYDVIAYLEAGFIGYWGEWNRSAYGLDNSSDARRAILFKILSVLPSDRMVAIRYPRYKQDAFNNENPLTTEEAFNGTNKSRTGAHNQCFLASIDDNGTYSSTDPNIINTQKNFLNIDNQYVVQGGEVCGESEYATCANALSELARMRWSALNFNPGDGSEILQNWRNQGCFEEIKRRLGYRFRLLTSVVPNNIKIGEIISIKLEITNDGWASPYNPRKLEVILRNRATKVEYSLPVDENPRRWMPGITTIANISGTIPADMPPGEYQVLLNLSDPTPKLSNRPEYSIRFANQNVWEESTGYNSLLRTVNVN